MLRRQGRTEPVEDRAAGVERRKRGHRTPMLIERMFDVNDGGLRSLRAPPHSFTEEPYVKRTYTVDFSSDEDYTPDQLRAPVALSAL